MAGVGVFDPVWSRSPAQCLLKVDCELLGGGVVWFSNRPGHRPKVRPALTVKACDNRPNPWGPKGVPHQISGNLPPPPLTYTPRQIYRVLPVQTPGRFTTEDTERDNGRQQDAHGEANYVFECLEIVLLGFQIVWSFKQTLFQS